MKIILIIVFVFLRGSNGVQNVYTKEEYEAFYNWRYQYDKTTFFRAAGQVKSDMETIINDYRAIKEHNGKFKKGNETYYQDLWKKSALDESSRKKITSGFNLIDFNAIFAPKTASRMFQKSRFADLFTVKQANFSAAPNSLDWREYNVVSPVQDQLYECASCWSFSAVAAIESAYALTTGKVVKLSEQQLVDCNFNAVTGNWGCWVNRSNIIFVGVFFQKKSFKGGWMAAAFAYLVISNGLTNESDYPYTDTKNPCQFNASLSQVAVGSFVILPTRDEEVLKRTVAAVGPISVRKN